MTALDLPAPSVGERAGTSAGSGPEVADLHIGGLVRLRAIGATPGDRAALERQFGPARPSNGGPAHLRIRFVDRIADPGPLRYLGPGEHGFTDDGFYVLQGRFRRPVRVRLPLSPTPPGREPVEILCEHGVGRIPHLVALVNLAVLDLGGVALHASAFVLDGTGVVATGWSKGGKTEALLAASLLGARYVADEWTHVHPDGSVTGIREPVRLWDWHLAQLPGIATDLPGPDRHRLAALRQAHRLTTSRWSSPRLASAIDRQRHVDVPPELLDRRAAEGGEPVPAGGVVLMTSADQASCTRHDVAPREVADRMAASLAYERLPLLGVLAAHRFAFPDRATPSPDELFERERDRLRALFVDRPAVEVRHPHHVDLRELGGVLRSVTEGWS